MPDPKYELFEVEAGRCSYRFGEAASGEVYPSREAAGIAAEQTGDKLAAALTREASSEDSVEGSGDIEALDRERLSG